MTLLDSTPSSKAFFDAGLNESGFGALTTDDTPSENWPYGQNTIPRGRQPLIGKLLAIKPRPMPPARPRRPGSSGPSRPISSVWTGAPLGVAVEPDRPQPFRMPDGQFVAPSLTAAASGRLPRHPGGHVRSDDRQPRSPSTRTPLTCPPTTASSWRRATSSSRPTGLSADKARALAQFVRYVAGSEGPGRNRACSGRLPPPLPWSPRA